MVINYKTAKNVMPYFNIIYLWQEFFLTFVFSSASSFVQFSYTDVVESYECVQPTLVESVCLYEYELKWKEVLSYMFGEHMTNSSVWIVTIAIPADSRHF